MPKPAMLVTAMFLLCACAAPSPSRSGLEKGRLSSCPDIPNCVNSEEGSGKATILPLHYASATGQAWKNLHQAIVETGGRIVEDEPGYLRAVYTSQLLRFDDDLECRLDREEPVIHLRSASRVGYWDLGVNRRRVEKIRRIFNGLDDQAGQDKN